ncbi:imidazole glycerol phosphate synthase subunit HisH [Candidatus Vidania fulgoroideae]|uniref:Imidazole glycerol phosphate synthase subunit HisH n=1 Tax=Candidatus Vidania fulgoroideorum TaxID=881286 RepID=A0AAX3NCA9_9PROT|nr:imidazole glycerol phosphate synthase subunit HisH [Candidatus Vidania fulgoroideae]
MKVGILNLGYGNLFSIKNALKKIISKKNIFFISKIKQLKKVDKIIFPGNGSIIDCFNNMNKINFLFLLRKFLIKKKKPFLGICLGKQILFNFNKEGKTNGLGIFKGNILRIKAKKVPFIGWSKIKSVKKHSITNDIKKLIFYFSHSYYLSKKKFTYYKVNYSNNNISSIFILKNFFLLQFHPEKSSYQGLKILKNFIYDNSSLRYIQ